MFRLEQCLYKYPDRPLRIYESIMRALRQLEMKCKDELVPCDDARIEDFKIDLDNSALDLINFDKHIREALRFRAAARFERMSEGDRVHYLVLMEYLAELSSKKLSNEMSIDSQVATSLKSDEVLQAEARYRTGSRAIRMYRLINSRN